MNPEYRKRYEGVKSIVSSIGAFAALLTGIYALATSVRFTSQDFETPGLSDKQLSQMRSHNVTHHIHHREPIKNEEYRQYMLKILDREVDGLPGKLDHKHTNTSES